MRTRQDRSSTQLQGTSEMRTYTWLFLLTFAEGHPSCLRVPLSVSRVERERFPRSLGRPGLWRRGAALLCA